MRKELANQVAIVSGGGSGIGRGVAVALGKQGVKVVVFGRRMEPLQETVSGIQENGGQGLAIQADMARAEDIQRAVKTTVDTFGTVDIAINNAGVFGSGKIHRHSLETWDTVMDINLRGPFILARTVLPLMRRQRSGHIINISSESGIEYYPGNGAYGVSKHALNALAEFIQRENQDHNIRMDTICPGMVVTEMTQHRPGLNQDKCLWPEDIAELVLWLLTRRNNIKIGTPVLIQTMENPWQ